MKKRTRLASLFMAAVLAVTSVVPVFASGSKQAEPISDSTKVGIEDEYVVSTSENTVPEWKDSEIVIFADEEIVSEAPITVPTKTLISQLTELSQKGKGKVKLEPASQAGSKFKGYKVYINGKAKIVKKLTYKQLRALGGSKKIALIPVFTALKFNVSIKAVKMPNGTKVKGRNYKNATYDSPVNLAVPSSGYKRTASANGCEFLGYSTTKGGAANVSSNEVIKEVSGKTLKLYPVFK